MKILEVRRRLDNTTKRKYEIKHHKMTLLKKNAFSTYTDRFSLSVKPIGPIQSSSSF